MAKATLTLKSGTTVTIEGEVQEVQRLVELWEHRTDAPQATRVAPVREGKAAGRVDTEQQQASGLKPHEIANAAKECAEASAIEKHILTSVRN